jgi:hypothetical protein
MATLSDAIRTVEAMAEIPCLRGGYACFDKNLDPEGWDTTQDNLGCLWVLVPEGPSDAAKTVEDGIAEYREGLLHMLDWVSSREASRFIDEPSSRDHYNAALGALIAVA